MQASRIGAVPRSERRFYTGMALAILATVLVGSARSFYLKPVFPGWPAPLDHLDRVQLREVITVCRQSRSIAEAGR